MTVALQVCFASVCVASLFVRLCLQGVLHVCCTFVHMAADEEIDILSQHVGVVSAVMQSLTELIGSLCDCRFASVCLQVCVASVCCKCARCKSGLQVCLQVCVVSLCCKLLLVVFRFRCCYLVFQRWFGKVAFAI